MSTQQLTRPEWERMLTQAVSNALEYRGFNDYGKYLDDTFLEHIRPVVDSMLTAQRDAIVDGLEGSMGKVHEGDEEKSFKTGMLRGLELARMIVINL